jgi:hypothetical protein
MRKTRTAGTHLIVWMGTTALQAAVAFVRRLIADWERRALASRRQT